ncbi:MAG TPA: hypothetical protein VEZ17_15320 [Chitinophagaceae bacterium]|jgi:hypothetical protein|nr:hypothetical protein [Chitinophagaceae bacterium]
MTTYKQIPALIIDLHEKGYTEDFKMKNGSFFWIQEQLSVPQREFYIAETYQIVKGGKKRELHAVVWTLANLKGIVICPRNS